MQFDSGHVVLDFGHKPVIHNGATLTLGVVAVDVLLANIGGVDAKEKIRRCDIAETIATAREPLDLPVEDVAMVKKLIGEFASPLVVKRCWHAIDNPKPRLALVEGRD